MEISNELKIARRELLSIPGLELLDDFYWDGSISKWILKIRLKGTYNPTDFVPLVTDWYCLISPSYPYGEIEIHPSLDNGIGATFPHQSHNMQVKNRPWRSGKICVTTSFGIWGEKYFNKEPFAAKERLHWHFERCRSWLLGAATGSLVAIGDPFEMPSIPCGNDNLVSFNENEQTFEKWMEVSEDHGYVVLKEIFSTVAITPIISFEAKRTKITYEWGDLISNSKSGREIDGTWVMFKKIPILDPWDIPITWQQLFDIANEQGVKLKQILLENVIKAKNKTPALLIVGFPIPKEIGAANERIYWLAINLPKIPTIKNGGFRKGSKELYSFQFNLLFRKENNIQWTNCENWHKEEISVRGKLPPKFTDLKFAIIGVGAVGSHLAELMVRMGCDNLTLIDCELLSVGNLSRHNLTLENIFSGKAEKLAKRLNSIMPSAKITNHRAIFGYELPEAKLKSLLEEVDVFIDATGDDSTLHFAGLILNNTDKWFISISTGFAANRLFLFMRQTTNSEIEREFRDKVTPWLQKEQSENPNPEFPREGIGCWHPVFPARQDNISLLVSASLNRIESFICDGGASEFLVIERKVNKDGVFEGLKIIADK